jgi:transposase-like protein
VVITDRQRQVREAWERTGSVTAVGRELGISPEAVRRSMVASERSAAGNAILRPGEPSLPERMDAIEATLTRIEAMLAKALARPTTIIDASGRRIADGGEGARRQRRRLSRLAS